MPQPLSVLHGIALPLLRDNIDTDTIIPVWENTRVAATGFGDALFSGHRYTDGIGHTPNPTFILNKPPYDKSVILITGSNFGSGSSRETAVWALRDFGFRVVIAASFNETFKRNCIINGLAPLQVEREKLEALVPAIQASPQRGMTVDIAHGSLWLGEEKNSGRTGSSTLAFSLDPYYVNLLTTGRTEDDLLSGLQTRIDSRRGELLERAPWLRFRGPRDDRTAETR